MRNWIKEAIDFRYILDFNQNLLFFFICSEFRDKHPQENELQMKKKKKKSTIEAVTNDTLDLRCVPKNQHTFMKLPKKGDFDLNSVLDSVYFFS